MYITCIFYKNDGLMLAHVAEAFVQYKKRYETCDNSVPAGAMYIDHS